MYVPTPGSNEVVCCIAYAGRMRLKQHVLYAKKFLSWSRYNRKNCRITSIVIKMINN